MRTPTAILAELNEAVSNANHATWLGHAPVEPCLRETIALASTLLSSLSGVTHSTTRAERAAALSKALHGAYALLQRPAANTEMRDAAFELQRQARGLAALKPED